MGKTQNNYFNLIKMYIIKLLYNWDVKIKDLNAINQIKAN